MPLENQTIDGLAYVFHPSGVAIPGKLHLKQDGVYTWQAGFLEDIFVRLAL